MFPSAVRGTSRVTIFSPTLGSLSQKSYNVLQKTQTSQHFPTIQVKHVKCLHENSKLMFSHRKLPTLLLHHQSPTVLLCVPQACDGFLRMSETQSLWLIILILPLCLACNSSFSHTCLKRLHQVFFNVNISVFLNNCQKSSIERYKYYVNI